MRVALVDDSALFRQGLAGLLRAVEVEVVAEAADGPDLVDRLDELRELDGIVPDVVVADIRMPPSYTDEGLQLVRRLRAEHPTMSALVLSTYAETPIAVRLIEHGSRGLGYLLKDRVTTVAALHTALRRVHEGESVIDPDIVDRLMAVGARRNVLDVLTDRERDVLRAMAEGRSNSGIAADLYLSERTVENYAARIFTKLSLPSDSDANRRVLAVLTWLRNTTSTT